GLGWYQHSAIWDKMYNARIHTRILSRRMDKWETILVAAISDFSLASCLKEEQDNRIDIITLHNTLPAQHSIVGLTVQHQSSNLSGIVTLFLCGDRQAR